MGTLSIVQNRAENIVKGAVGVVVESGASIVEAGYQTVVNNEDFLTHENQIHLTRLCQMGIYSVTADAIMGDTVPDSDNCQLQGDACNLPEVENGVFNGDAQDLQFIERLNKDKYQIPPTWRKGSINVLTPEFDSFSSLQMAQSPGYQGLPSD